MADRKVLDPDDLKTEVVSIHTLRPHPDNPRNGDTDLIVQSIKAHGQFRPILVSQDNVVIAGNHTYMAMMELEKKFIVITRLPIDHDDPQAIEIMLMDNRASDVAKYDDGALLSLLDRVKEQQHELLAAGFNDDFHKNLLAKLNAEPPDDFKELGEDVKTDYRCPSCGYEWSGKPK